MSSSYEGDENHPLLRRVLPRSLLGRSLLIIVTPLIMSLVILLSGCLYFGRTEDTFADIV